MIENVAAIVSAYVGKNRVDATELPAVIASVSQAFASLGPPADAPAAPLTPAIPIRRSVGADTLICLDCGWKGKMLKRHLSAAHGIDAGGIPKPVASCQRLPDGSKELCSASI